jgi:hypothetical protein
MTRKILAEKSGEPDYTITKTLAVLDILKEIDSSEV